MNKIINILTFCFLIIYSNSVTGQKIIEKYENKKKDSIRIGVSENNFIPCIQRGYTLMLPDSKTIKGVLIFLEDSGYDAKNKSAKQMYEQANETNYAVLSVSTEIPFDFYFSESSIKSVHNLIQKAFLEHQLPNKNNFFLGASLVGHRAMKYIEFTKALNYGFQLNIKGIVICNFTMDWTRKWHQHRREIRINRNNLGEAKFINYMLETHLKGTPDMVPESYYEFSSYSYFDKKNRNIKYYKNLAVRTYIEPDIKYKFTKYLRTLYENNATDMVGFMAELELAGNRNTELIILQPEDNPSTDKSTQGTWNAINKNELINWIIKQ